MKLIRSVRIAVGKFLLKRKVKKLDRIKTVHNLDSAKTLGIVFEYKDEDEFKIIEEFIAQIKAKKIDVKALVLLPYVKLLEYIPQKLSIDFITPNDLDSMFYPTGHRVHEFIATPFDILIDLNTNKIFSLEYVTAMSKASYKLGVYDESKQHVYDLMLKMPSDEKLSTIIEQSIRYLDMLKPA